MSQRLFVISDLHAFDGAVVKDQRPSHYDLSLPSGEGDNPIQQLKEFIQSSGIKADKLICCGDLADKAYPSGVERAWADVQQIKNLLGADDILASVGNHDVDSRHNHNDHDAIGVLLGLNPGFPFSTEDKNNQFWTHHFCIEDKNEKVRYITLNSSGFHGVGGEHQHGRVTNRTLVRLKNELQKGGRRQANVLICHHHPQRMNELKLGDYDDMKGGDDLLRLLDAVEFGPWLIIHGHKHFPKLTYATGGSASPVVFSAGSCAAILYPEIVRHAGNQAYLITLTDSDEVTTSCCGEYQAWDWAPGCGWKVAHSTSGLPSRGGFGYRGDHGALAKEISGKFPNGSKWISVEQDLLQLKHLIPADLKSVLKLLTAHFGYNIEENAQGTPILFEK